MTPSCKWPIVLRSLSQFGKTCLLGKRLPLCAEKEMAIFHLKCDLWCMYSCDFVILENNIYAPSMHSLNNIHFGLCFFVFIAPLAKNDLILCVYCQFIAPSLYNQIT